MILLESLKIEICLENNTILNFIIFQEKPQKSVNFGSKTIIIFYCPHKIFFKLKKKI